MTPSCPDLRSQSTAVSLLKTSFHPAVGMPGTSFSSTHRQRVGHINCRVSDGGPSRRQGTKRPRIVGSSSRRKRL